MLSRRRPCRVRRPSLGRTGVSGPSRSLAVLLLSGLAAASTASCGDDGADARISRERDEAAQIARQQEQIKELRRQQRDRRSQGDRAVAAQPTTSDPPAANPDPGATAGRVPDSGTYSGMGSQRGARAETSKDYAISMTFSSGGSFVSYPHLECEGRLVPTGFDGARRVYREEITSGSCDRGGTWRVEVRSSTALSATWSLPSTDYVVAADLTR